MLVYVLSKKGKPLMPTNRFCHIKKLLKNGKAVPVCNNPFTIKLKYETPDIVQPLTCGIDVGRENIGIGVSNEEGECVFLCNVKTNNKQVKQNMMKRKAHRQSRRHNHRQKKQRKALSSNNQIKNGNKDTLRSKKDCLSKEISYPRMEESITHKVIKGKEAKFANRKVKKGWITPSARNLVEIHANVVKKIGKFLPINNVIIENNVFDFQKLEDCNIKAWQYSKGPLYGFRDYNDYIIKQQNNKCLLCQENPVEHCHHIIPKHRNGSDSVANIAGLCNKCHTLVHTKASYEKKLLSLKKGMHKKYEVSLLNSCMGNIIDKVSKLYPTQCTDGYETYKLRNTLNLDKDHCVDGYVISLANNPNKEEIEPRILSNTYTIKHFKKKCGSIIANLNSRKYYYQGKLVATNRHKGFEQKTNSLEDYKENYLKTHTIDEWDKHFHELTIKPAKRTYTYRKQGIRLIFKCGDVIKYIKYNKTKDNTKTKIFVAEQINFANERIYKNNTQNVKMKFCHSIQSNSLEFI
jgi:hypothetical protein